MWLFFFFKQKTAYEMRISDWSSDVCSSDLKHLIAAMARVKSYLDYGAFTPIQAAACAALNGPQDIVEKNRALYHKRRDVLVESFGRAGWDIPSPPASMFAWADRKSTRLNSSH